VTLHDVAAAVGMVAGALALLVAAGVAAAWLYVHQRVKMSVNR